MGGLNRASLTRPEVISRKGFTLPNETAIQKLGADANSDTFNVLSFLDSSRASRKILQMAAKEKVFLQGDRAADVFYIQKGVIQLSTVSANGKTAVSAILGPGDFCGVWCLAGQPRRIATAIVVEAATLRVIPAEQMRRLLRTHHEFANHFISFLLAKNIQIGQRLISFLFDSAEKRLIRTILFLSQFGIDGENGEISLPHVSQDNLAEMVGSSRTYVNGLMRKLKRLGLIEYDGSLKIHPAPILSLL